MMFTNETEVLINAVQRSAHHVFIMELIGSASKYCFVNCIRDSKVFNKQYIDANRDERLLTDLDVDVESELQGIHVQKNLLLYNLESFKLDSANELFQKIGAENSVGGSHKRHFVTWIRDPINNLASLYQNARRRFERGEMSAEELRYDPRLLQSIDAWMSHWSPEADNLSAHHLTVVMNRYITDNNYRAGVFARLGLPVSQRYAKTSIWGRGSSFRRFKSTEPGPTIDDLEGRYLHFIDDPNYIQFFNCKKFQNSVESFVEAVKRPKIEVAWRDIGKRIDRQF